MKKISHLLFAFLIMFTFTITVNAETLNQYISQAEANRAASAAAEKQQKLSKEEKKQVEKDIESANKQIKEINDQVKSLEKEIEELQIKIKSEEKEIKSVVKFEQMSDSQFTYLEYIFGASSFTDFIYRISVAEQLSKYSDDLIKEYNSQVEELDQKQKELETKQNKLNKKLDELAKLKTKLNSQIAQISDDLENYETKYKVIMSYVSTLKSMGCRGSENIKTCQKRLDNSIGNTSSGSVKYPLTSGYLTSDYGYNPGRSDYHTGMDFSNGSHGSNVYSVAKGKVIAAVVNPYGGSCGNHIVYIQHKINGKTYTTSYWHMTSFKVSTGQSVTSSTAIGTEGGYASEDECSAGTHVHVNLFNGSVTSNNGRINPRKIFGYSLKKGGYFSSPR